MKIGIKFTSFSNQQQLHHVVGCVSWSSFDPKQTETLAKLISETF